MVVVECVELTPCAETPTKLITANNINSQTALRM